MTPAEARAALAGHVVVPDADDLDDAAFVEKAAKLADDPTATLDAAARVPSWGRPDPDISAHEERDFQMRQAGCDGLDTPALRKLRDDAASDPDHPFAVAGRVEPLGAEEPTDA